MQADALESLGRLAGQTVLVCEDEGQLRNVTARILESCHFRVLAAADAHEALRLLETDTDISLLLTDVVMPRMSGMHLVRNARALRPNLRLLYMSGFPRDLMEHGRIDPDLPLIEKPFDSDSLLRRVADALAHDP